VLGSRGGSRVGGEGELKEVMSVMRVVEFGFWLGSVSESESSAHDAADASMAQRQMVKRVDGKGVMSAVSKAMYVSRDAAGRLVERTLSSSQCCVSAPRRRCY
jgi:hypothetical protein